MWSLRVDLRFGFDRKPQPHRLEYGDQGFERRIALGRERAIKRLAADPGLGRDRGEAAISFRHAAEPCLSLP